MDADIVKSLIAANVADLEVVDFDFRGGGLLVRAADGSLFVVCVKEA